jgi:hypothetical protein
MTDTDGPASGLMTDTDGPASGWQLSTVPKALPCREEEQGQIRGVLREAITQGQCGGCIYISGVPGTGKTASVHAIIREMTRESEATPTPSTREREGVGVCVRERGWVCVRERERVGERER